MENRINNQNVNENPKLIDLLINHIEHRCRNGEKLLKKLRNIQKECHKIQSKSNQTKLTTTITTNIEQDSNSIKNIQSYSDHHQQQTNQSMPSSSISSIQLSQNNQTITTKINHTNDSFKRKSNHNEIETANKLRKQISNSESIDQNYRAVIIKRPFIQFKGIHKSISSDKLPEIISKSNWQINDYLCSMKQIPSEAIQIRFSRKNQKSSDFIDYVVQIDHQLREIINKNLKRKIIINNENVQTIDFPIRCYNCIGFNHMSFDCETEQVCFHCSGYHRHQDCSKKDELPICCNCKTEQIRNQKPHNPYSFICPVYQRMLEQAISQFKNRY